MFRLHGHRGAGRRGCRAVPAARGADRPRRPGHARRHPRQCAGRGADAAQAAGARPQPARCAAGTTPQSPPTRNPVTATWRHTTRSMTSSQLTASSSLEASAAAAHADAPRRPAHPQRPRTSAALQARAESTPEIPAGHRDEGNRHREPAGHRVRPRVLISTAAARPGRKEEPPRPPGPADRGTARHPRRGRGQKPCPHPGTPSRKRTQEQTRNTKLEKPPNATNT